jgi:hypothetical protein
MLKPSSVPNEYYFGDLPGTLQYKMKPDDLLLLDLPKNTETCGYNLSSHSAENLKRITPHTKKQLWRILLMMESKRDNGEIWLKAAIQDRTTGDIALLTSTNKKEKLKRPIKTMDETWFVGHYRMSAPVVFWEELQNRLLF